MTERQPPTQAQAAMPSADGATTAQPTDIYGLVGLRFRSASGVLTRHYYLCEESVTQHRALRLARQKAEDPAERNARHHVSLDDTWVEVRAMKFSRFGTLALLGEHQSIC
ncbi:hypothetical protein OG930_38535 [Streptomyces sp. NBC_01799]|uniref:hypothetical protein n=1 Tax=Streptomyces sp. NBC_01800 TaxID=2975945 RepID=UPI002DD9AC23|nr:hypothetical protein [Streptomyces sp. NBC_01800]WSA72461.1 hypothetical protein OIE65_39160 [Streptomyces sp. NBC_01800]WSA80985.1 hypothetical protein OG930_38535 [Streptomyces sp. NBC_01799]